MLHLEHPESALLPLLKMPKTPLLPATFFVGKMPFELSRSILVHIAQGRTASRAKAAQRMGLDWRTVRDWSSPEYLIRHPEMFHDWLPSWQAIEDLPDTLAPGSLLVLTGLSGSMAVSFEEWVLMDREKLSEFSHWMVL